jgi:hypothetical protein
VVESRRTRRTPWALAVALAAAALLGCGSFPVIDFGPENGDSGDEGGGSGGRKGLQGKLKASAKDYFGELSKQGVRAQSHFAVFVPDGSVNIRHLKKFRRALRDGVRAASAKKSITPMFSASKVFLLSEVKAEGWESADLPSGAAGVLAREWENGTQSGWVAFHAYWAQFNRLAIGDKTWIDSLPDSVRGDLSNPLVYVLVVGVHLEEQRDATTFVHTLNLQFVEVGSERVVFEKDYTLTLAHRLP